MQKKSIIVTRMSYALIEAYISNTYILSLERAFDNDFGDSLLRYVLTPNAKSRK